MKNALLLIAVAGLLPLAGCLTTGSIKATDAPQWESGYAFTWNTTGSLHLYSFNKKGGEEAATQTVDKPLSPFSETIEVLNTTMQVEGDALFVGAYHNTRLHGPRAQAPCTPSTQAGGASSPRGPPVTVPECGTLLGLMAFRQDDLGGVNLGYTWKSSCTNGICKYSLSDLRRLGPKPQYDYIDFPLTTGKEWGGELKKTGTSVLRVEKVSRVVGAAKVDTPLGAIDAIKIEVRQRPMNLAEFKDSIREEAREEGASISSLDYDVGSVVFIYYSDLFQTVVKVDTQYYERLNADGKDEDGKSFEVKVDQESTSQTVIVGAQLVAKPERNLDYISRVLAGEIPLADPAGVLPQVRRLSISITSDVPAVNAAEAASATFGAKVTEQTGNGSVPAKGIDLQWTVYDYQNQAVATAKEPTLAHQFASPGLYGVQADAIDATTGKLVGSAQIPFEAFYEKEHTMQELFTMAGLRQHPSLKIPVRPGISLLEITATPQGVTGPLSMGELDVRDAANRRVADQRSPRQLILTDFSETFVGKGDWTVMWDTPLSAMESVVLTIKERYGDGSTAQTMPAPAAPLQDYGFVPLWGQTVYVPTAFSQVPFEAPPQG